MIEKNRQDLRTAQKIVIKVGSQALIQNEKLIPLLASQVYELRKQGRSIVLVCSGAVAFGIEKLGLTERPKDVHTLQAAAAVGQSKLMHFFERAFSLFQIQTAQFLFTHSIFSDRNHYQNARRTMDELFTFGVVPIINENDSVSAEEIGFGDNDQLAAMTSTMIEADALFLLTNVGGLLNQEGQVVSQINEIGDAQKMVQQNKSAQGLGGMSSKLLAAHRATINGTSVLIANAHDENVLLKIVDGEIIGTFFPASASPLSRRKHWIAFTLRTLGTLQVDKGAEVALLVEKTSLLPIGVTQVSGKFDAGDAVSIVDADGKEIAKGLSRYASEDAKAIARTRSDDIKKKLGWFGGDVLVHRDDMVFEP